MKKNLAGIMLQKVAGRIGARVILNTPHGFAGEITYKSGRRRYFRAASLDINPLGSSEIAKDKDYAAYYMRASGYPTAEGEAFFSKGFGQTIGSKKGFDAACAYAEKIGFPVMVKPNSKSQGQGVAAAYDASEFSRTLKHVFKIDRIGLVQRKYIGEDYRIVVLDGKIVCAYKRMPLSVVGDGRTTILGLLRMKQKEFDRIGRDTEVRVRDYRIKMNLDRAGKTFESILGSGERMYLLDNANLSSGGDAEDVTAEIHPEFARIAAALVRDMGLRFCGVDIIARGGIGQKPSEYCILEINASPGLDNYASLGEAELSIVENAYRALLEKMENLEA